MLQPNEQRSHSGFHRTASPRSALKAEQCGLLHVAIDDPLLSQAGELGVRLRPFAVDSRGDGSMRARVEPIASGPASASVAQEERHTAGRPGARTGSLRSASTLLSFAPILLWAAAVLDAMGGVLSGVPAVGNAFGGLLAGSTLASAVVIASHAGWRRSPSAREAGAEAPRRTDPAVMAGRRS